MKTALLSLSFISLAITGGAAETADTKPTVTGNTAFALDLYGKLRTQEGNLFLSPYSISTALAMTCGGARGNTEKQMAAALRFTVPQEQLHLGFAALQSRLNAVQQKSKVTLTTANAIWVQQGYAVKPPFTELCRTRYQSEVNTADFAGNKSGACRTINDWVAGKTQQRIKNILAADKLPDTVRMILVNAIYFKGDWASRFDKQRNYRAEFQVVEGRTPTVEFMAQLQNFPYAETPKLQLLEMPYTEKSLSMLVLLPSATSSLAELEASLTASNLAVWVGAMRPMPVAVLFPKFEFAHGFDLRQALESLGMTDAFRPERAALTGISTEPRFHLGPVLHEAFVKVNEEGTEAAAATTGHGIGCSASYQANFRADRPFLFLIRDNSTGSILFLGRVVDPTQ